MILDEIVRVKKKRLAKDRERLLEIKKRVENRVYRKSEKSFLSNLKKDGISIIGEIKKASPSKGIIREDFDYLNLAKEYETSVDCISVLTERDFFQGDEGYLREISGENRLPLLRKDFIIDELQIYESKDLGASAILLIVTILEEEKLKSFLELCERLELDALVEVHTREEARIALEVGAKIIGINNRDLKTFKVDINRAINLSKELDRDIVVVAESGIKTKEDIKKIVDAGIDAVLIGETFMRCDSIESLARGFKSA